jgi:hypothetical protein
MEEEAVKDENRRESKKCGFLIAKMAFSGEHKQREERKVQMKET